MILITPAYLKNPIPDSEKPLQHRGYVASHADVRNWHRLAGGRALSRREVNDLTVKTYPASGWDYVAEFARREYPVAIVGAEQDSLDTGAPLLKAWASQVPRLELTILPSAGHLPWIDQPEAFREALRRHLGRADDSTTAPRR